MAERRSWPVWARVLLALPLVVVPVVAFVALAGGSRDSSVQVAPGATGGMFHPVAGGFEPDESTLESCEDDAVCLQQAFGNTAYRQGAKAALRLFEEQISRDQRVRDGCHQIAHVIGSAAFARHDEDVGRTFAVGSPVCASGYYHGILERAFVGVNTKAKLVDVARGLCDAEGIRRYGFLDYQCRHGLGHGLMIQTGYDLPLALSTCDHLQSRWDTVACTGGVFMENVTTRFGFRSSWLDDSDPLHPCGAVARRHQRSCYQRAAVRILTLNGNDFEATAGTCAALAAADARACFRGYGRDAVRGAHNRPATIFSLCRLAGAGEGDCLYGAARTIGDGSGVPGARRAARLCSTAAGDVRVHCFGGLGVIVGLLYSTHEARRWACAELASSGARACSRAAVAEVDPSGRGAWG